MYQCACLVPTRVDPPLLEEFFALQAMLLNLLETHVNACGTGPAMKSHATRWVSRTTMETILTAIMSAEMTPNLWLCESPTLAHATMQQIRTQTNAGERRLACFDCNSSLSPCCSLKTVLILFLDSRCCGDMDHFDLSIWAFEKVRLLILDCPLVGYLPIAFPARFLPDTEPRESV